MAKSGILDPGKTGFFQTHFLRVFEQLEPDKGGHVQNIIFLRVFEKWDPDIFQKSEISKISCSSHSKNAHIKLNLDSWCRAERCGPPFIFYGLDVEIRPKWTLPGSAPTHPSCLSIRGGAKGTREAARANPSQSPLTLSADAIFVQALFGRSTGCLTLWGNGKYSI